MITPVDLSIWLRSDTVDRAQALLDLIESHDLMIVPDDETFTVCRRHSNGISYLELGSAIPLLPRATD
jgi:hypothetical protein